MKLYHGTNQEIVSIDLKRLRKRILSDARKGYGY